MLGEGVGGGCIWGRGGEDVGWKVGEEGCGVESGAMIYTEHILRMGFIA